MYQIFKCEIKRKKVETNKNMNAKHIVHKWVIIKYVKCCENKCCLRKGFEGWHHFQSLKAYSVNQQIWKTKFLSSFNFKVSHWMKLHLSNSKKNRLCNLILPKHGKEFRNIFTKCSILIPSSVRESQKINLN